MSSGPSDSLEERIQGSRLKSWVLLEANRRVIAGVILVGFFLALVALIQLWPAPLRPILAESDPVETMFQALTTATITAVTLVITINQLVLSQELGAVGDQRERMQAATEFRHDVGEYLEEPAAPAEPASFLDRLIGASQKSAIRLGEALEDHPDDDLREAVDEYVDDLVENAEEVSEELGDAQFGSYDLVSAAVDYNYSWKLYRAEYLQGQYADSLDDEQDEAFEQVTDVLQLFAPAREHFKTLYFQWELTDLSRGMLYAALPALIVSLTALMFLDQPTAAPGATLGVQNVVWLVAAAASVVMLPFVILMSYILRIATIAKRTLAMGPFVLRADERTGGDVDADRGDWSTDD
jgi:hypothetical protein